MKHFLSLMFVFLWMPSIQHAIWSNVHTKEVITVLDMRHLLKKDLTRPNEVKEVWDELHTLATLQGIVNRDKPSLYIKYVTEGNCCIDQYWWDKYRQPGKWLASKDTLELTSTISAIRFYRNKINGIVTYDSEVASTSNVASSIAGIENLIAVRYDKNPNSLYQKLKHSDLNLKEKVMLVNADGTSIFTGKGCLPGINIPSSGSVKADPYLWFIEKYLKKGKCNTQYAADYIDQYWRKQPKNAAVNHHTLTNHDFFVAKKAFFFDLSPWGDEPATDDPEQSVGTDLEVMKSMFAIAYQQNKGKKMCHVGGFPVWAFKYTRHAKGKHYDVATEWEFSKIISAYNAFKDADAINFGALANASFWQHFPLQKSYPQHWTSKEELIQRGFLKTDGQLILGKKNFIIFYVGDYDASAWVTQLTHRIWDDPNRGKVPLMWCFSPILEVRAPMVMDYVRKTATHLDYFASADNGAGYLMPGMLQEPRPISGLPSGLKTWEKHCKKYYEKWGLSITGFVIDGSGPGLNKDGMACYEKFSPNGIVPQKSPMTLLFNDMPVLRSDIDVNQEPIEAAKQIIERVKQRPIPFHWFRNILKRPTWYVEVMKEVKRLDPDIELLDAPTFFELYRTYLQQHPEAANGKI